MSFLGFGPRAPRRVVEPVVPQGYNYPRSTAGDTGIKTFALPKGLSAPIPMRMPDAIVDQRLSERIQAFAPRLPLQTFLRQQKVVQVIPQQGVAHVLVAPGNETALVSPYANGLYNVDYSLQTDMGRVHAGSLGAPPRFQSTPGYADISATMARNGQYASINANLSSLYTNLRAPKPFEGQLSCQ